MKKFASALFAVCLSFPLIVSAQKSDSAQNPSIIPVSQIHAGMHGVAYTVFEGVKPEAMEVEVLGVLHNVNGPKGDVIPVSYTHLDVYKRQTLPSQAYRSFRQRCSPQV